MYDDVYPDMYADENDLGSYDDMGDEPDVDYMQEQNDFAHDDDMDNYVIEDQFLDGMYEE